MDGVCKVSLDAIRQLNCLFFPPKFTACCCVRCRKGPVYNFRAAKSQKQWQVLSFTAGVGSEQLPVPSQRDGMGSILLPLLLCPPCPPGAG